MGKKKMNRKKKKKIIIISASSVLVISLILFLLAYRYLIERVEAPVVDNSQSTITPTSTVGSSDTEAEDESAVVSDDWNYSRNGLKISIKQVEEGSGNNKITYYNIIIYSNLCKISYSKKYHYYLIKKHSYAILSL